MLKPIPIFIQSQYSLIIFWQYSLIISNYFVSCTNLGNVSKALLYLKLLSKCSIEGVWNTSRFQGSIPCGFRICIVTRVQLSQPTVVALLLVNGWQVAVGTHLSGLIACLYHPLYIYRAAPDLHKNQPHHRDCPKRTLGAQPFIMATNLFQSAKLTEGTLTKGTALMICAQWKITGGTKV